MLVKDIIKKYINAGCSIIQIEKGEKRPLCGKAWTKYQKELASEDEYKNWDLPIGMVCGAVSGGLICMDFDDHGSRFLPWIEDIERWNKSLMMKLVIQRTPSGGYHVLFRCPDYKNGNEKLARLSEKNSEGKIALIETRAEGGQFLVAPSEGYKLVQGQIEDIPTFTLDECETLLNYARSFNLRAKEMRFEVGASHDFEISPFDDYDSKNTPTDILLECGWKIINQIDDEILFCRPGKDSGISATWNHIPNRFYVFTTNTDFESETIYKPSAVFAILKTKGDFKAAAAQLIKMGYGKINPVKINSGEMEPVILPTYRAKDFSDDIIRLRTVGMPQGFSTGFSALDEFYKVARGQLNVVTGFPGGGKTEFMDAIMVNMAVLHDFVFLVFSPENFPLELHYQKLAEKFVDKAFLTFSKNDYDRAIEFIHEHFIFISTNDLTINVTSLLNTAQSVIDKGRIDGMIFDPWNEIESQRPIGMNESDFIGVSLSTIRKFSRKNHIATWIVAHPTKPKKEKDKNGNMVYAIPDLYSINGSANFFNKTDNGFVVHRDRDENVTRIIIQKIKFKFYGKLGEIRLRYKYDSGKFEPEMTSEELVIRDSIIADKDFSF